MTLETAEADVAIIGAGVVGCAMARRFALEGASCVLIEAAPDILAGASKANSAILHTGFDAPVGSLELACMQAGYNEYLQIRGAMNLPLLECGAMVAAWNDDEESRLPDLLAQAHANGVPDARLLSRDEARAREPHLSSRLRGALLVPREHVIDPWSAPLAYATQAQMLGARLLFNAALTGARRSGDLWHLTTAAGEIRAHSVINCAGLYGDRIETLLTGASRFDIRPRKGQFVVFDKAAARCLTSILLPVPNERTKGVVLTRTVFGNLLVGPTAEEQQARERPDVTTPELSTLIDTATRLVPGLRDMPVTAVYAGLRPASERKEYRIHADHELGYFCAGGIRSTGLTAALGIARHVFALWARAARPVAPPDPPVPVMPNLAEGLTRDWQRPGHDGIVCHCEMVTLRELRAALDSPVPPGDFGGLRRRTRCAMGRCQGFNCLARIATLTEGRLRDPILPEDRR
ncbi:NAD(P)/FAD-dependent oxidoreductase [Citreicella sp. C3M06]|uniref:NAD(P)/FAD-dependent oxidoreductase n=1 Tax=Citreicella sp. C3M06 TaxID=2841564 RepID=UPI0020915C77|nr:NAD(P)/FAD-dependent oxidoreductase [Citreicella sp. C3M06]